MHLLKETGFGGSTRIKSLVATGCQRWAPYSGFASFSSIPTVRVYPAFSQAILISFSTALNSGSPVMSSAFFSLAKAAAKQSA